jgi:xylulokinase
MNTLGTVERRSSALRAAGLDLGSTHLKAVCVDICPDTVPSVTVRALRRAPTPEGAEDLVALARRLLDEVVELGGPVAAVGVASMAETGVPLDARDLALTPLLRWDAARAEAAADRLGSEIAPAELFARTGVRLGPKTPLATWAWLAEEHPQVRARMRRWAGVADLVVLSLTGRLATDHTLAGRTGAFPLDGAGFDDDLLALVGLERSALPEVTAPDASVGEWHGLPVAIAGHDHQVGAYACGVRLPGDVANSLGTAEVVLRVLADRPDPQRVLAGGMSLVRTVSGGHDALLTGVGASGAAYAAWLEERDLNDPDPEAPALSSLFEELSRSTRRAYDEQVALDPAAIAPAPVTLFGGPGARNPVWTRIKAGLWPEGVRLVDQVEPVAVGAAVVAAERAGLIATGAVALPAESFGPGS